jgi:hypothetical protein
MHLGDRNGVHAPDIPRPRRVNTDDDGAGFARRTPALTPNLEKERVAGERERVSGTKRHASDPPTALHDAPQAIDAPSRVVYPDS